MKTVGSRKLADSECRWRPLAGCRHLALCVLTAVVLALAGGVSADDSDAISAYQQTAAGVSAEDPDAIPAYQETEANRDLVDGTEKLEEPLFSESAIEGALLGGFLGSVLSSATDNDAPIGFGIGATVGSLAGRYVEAKRDEYSKEVEVIDAITRDVQGKNEHATRTIKAMEVVIAEDRARLDQIRQARADGKISRSQLNDEVAFAERDLETMRRARDAAEEHLKTFVAARSLVLEDSKMDDLEKRSEVTSLDGEIEALRARIKTMHDLVDELSGVT